MVVGISSSNSSSNHSLNSDEITTDVIIIGRSVLIQRSGSHQFCKEVES